MRHFQGKEKCQSMFCSIGAVHTQVTANNLCWCYSHTNSTGRIWALEKRQEGVPKGHLTGSYR